MCLEIRERRFQTGFLFSLYKDALEATIKNGNLFNFSKLYKRYLGSIMIQKYVKTTITIDRQVKEMV